MALSTFTLLRRRHHRPSPEVSHAPLAEILCPHSPPPSPGQATAPLSASVNLTALQVPRISGIMPCLSFCVCLRHVALYLHGRSMT